MTAPYAAVAMQLTAQSVENCTDRAEARAQIFGMIEALEAKVRASAIFIEQYGGLPVKLAVLPEYLFTSYPGRISIADFADMVVIGDLVEVGTALLAQLRARTG